MSKVTTQITNFTAGEISPKAKGRFDINRYFNGVDTLENCMVNTVGGAFSRPGSRYVTEVINSSQQSRLIPFSFSTTQTYLIELGDSLMRFYSDEGVVLDDDIVISGATKADPCVITATTHGYASNARVTISDVVGMTELNGNTYNITVLTADTFSLQDFDDADIDSTGFTTYVSDGVSNKATQLDTPWATAQIAAVRFAQTADIMYLCSPDDEPGKILRTASNAFSFPGFQFFDGPFLADNDTVASTLEPSGDTGTGISVTAAGSGNAPFTANHVDSIWKIGDGHVLITGYTSSTVVTADVQPDRDGAAGDLNTGPAATDSWAEAAWSDERGWPQTVTFFEQRLVFGGTASDPQTIWASKQNDFENFSARSTNDADPWTYTISSEQVNRIRWLSGGPKTLQIGTSGGTHSASSGVSNEPITPTAIQVQRETSYGVKDITPQRIGGSIYYVQRNAKTVREQAFDFDIDAQRAADITILSDHITGDDGVTELAYQQSPNNNLWFVRDDGEIAMLTREIDQEVISWVRHIRGKDAAGDGLYESIAVIPVDDGDDQVWVIVKHTINGSTRRYIEFFEGQTIAKKEDAFYVDSGLTLDSPKTITAATKADPVVITSTGHGFSDDDQVRIEDVAGMTELNDKYFLVSNKAANTFELTDTDGNDIDGTAYTTYVSGGKVRKMVTSITGLGHLEGETVQVLADGAAREEKTVSSGAITLDRKAARVHVGLGYTAKIKGLPMVDGSSTGTGFGKDRRIYRATVLFHETIGAQYGVGDQLDTIIFRKESDPDDQSPPLFTGRKEVASPMLWDKLGQLTIQQTQPLPMNVLAVVLRSQVEDK